LQKGFARRDWGKRVLVKKTLRPSKIADGEPKIQKTTHWEDVASGKE